MGYSAFIFGEKAPDYCVFDQEDRYENQRMYMNIGCILLLFVILLASPVCLIAAYDYFNGKEGNVLFFLWSFLFVSAVAACMMLVYDIFTIIFNIMLYPSTPGKPYFDIFIFFVFFAALLGFLVLVDFLFTILALMVLRRSNRRKFPTPELIKVVKRIISNILCFCIKCGNKEGEAEREREELCRSECLTLLFAYTFFTLFMQLSSFHLLHIVLASICTPVETLSITSFYMACFFCVVAFIAIVFKATNSQEYYQTFKKENVAKCACILLAAALFIASMVLFIIFFYNYVIMVQSYTKNGGILVVIGSILPSALVSFGGFCGTRLIKYVQDPSNPTQAT